MEGNYPQTRPVYAEIGLHFVKDIIISDDDNDKILLNDTCKLAEFISV